MNAEAPWGHHGPWGQETVTCDEKYEGAEPGEHAPKQGIGGGDL